MNKKYLFILSLLLPPAMTNAQENILDMTTARDADTSRKWTLHDCITHALNNNITLKKNNVAILSSKENVEQAKAALLPSLSASTNQSIGWRPWNEAGVSTVANGTVVNKVSKTYYNGNYALNAQWTLWNGNKNRNTLKQNILEANKAELDSATNANALKEQIAELYVQILYLNEAIEVNRQSLATSIKNEERGRMMVEVGKMSKADLAQLTAQTKQDEYIIVNAQAETEKAKMQLKQILELQGDMTFDIVIPEKNDHEALANIPALQTVYEQALASRPEIAGSLLNIESQKIGVKIALRAIAANKTRSFLTALGIIIGIASVITMLAVGQGTKMSIQANIAEMGSNMIMIGPGADRRGGVRQDASSMETLKMTDYESIKDECTYIKAISPVVNKSGQFIYGNENTPSTIYGINQDYMEIRQLNVADGEMFTDADIKTSAKVCVLGQTVVDNLFPNGGDPIGKVVRFNSIPFRVVGVLKKKGYNSMGMDQDDLVLAP